MAHKNNSLFFVIPLQNRTFVAGQRAEVSAVSNRH